MTNRDTGGKTRNSVAGEGTMETRKWRQRKTREEQRKKVGPRRRDDRGHGERQTGTLDGRQGTVWQGRKPRKRGAGNRIKQQLE